MSEILKYDVVIVGGGPGGSHAAALLAQAGKRVAVIEREEYPRFHIGESLLPASMPLLKRTGFFDILNSGKYITKYGAHFIDYQTEDEIYFGFADGLNPDIPIAFEVEREKLDKDMLAFAAKCGADSATPVEVRVGTTGASGAAPLPDPAAQASTSRPARPDFMTTERV